MRRQLYEWQINRQTNGYPLANPTDGTTFEQIAGIPISIFTGGIGNNITMPAATTATQFVAIDNMRCSPSFFLSGAGVMAVYNSAFGAGKVLEATFTSGGFPGVGSQFTGNNTLNVDNIGTGYTALDVLTVAGGATIRVDTVDGGTGGVLLFTPLTPGGLYQVNDTPAITGGTGTGFGITLLRIGTGFVSGAANAMTTVTGTGTGGTIRVDTTGAFGSTLDMTSLSNAAPGVGQNYQVGDLFSIGGVNGLIGQVTSVGASTATDIPFTGAQPNPVYTPNATQPELTFQTTHVNPFTSIAGPMMFMQLLINTTSYFNETDGTVGPGLPGTASPCPETAACRSTFEFESPVYILPGQQWDVQVTVYNDSRGIIGDSTTTYNYSASDPSLTVTSEDLCCLVQYTLYDGPDALIATKLVEMGIAVRPENVDWYKRQLLEGTI
jgi:hypothetical protein